MHLAVGLRSSTCWYTGLVTAPYLLDFAESAILGTGFEPYILIVDLLFGVHAVHVSDTVATHAVVRSLS